MEVKFYLTSLVNDVIANNGRMIKAIDKAVKQFLNGDYGILPQESKEANAIDLINQEGKVLGQYPTPAGNIYINMEFIEEQNGSVTGQALIMLCTEY